MPQVNPIVINRPKPYLLHAEWEDGFKATISLETFRKNCPCAECTGEKIGDVVYSKPKPVKFEPGVFEITDLRTVGNYAVNPVWKNGHDTGIYTWEKFRKIFEDNQLSKEEAEKLNNQLKDDKRNIGFNIIS